LLLIRTITDFEYYPYFCYIAQLAEYIVPCHLGTVKILKDSQLTQFFASKSISSAVNSVGVSVYETKILCNTVV